MRGRLSMESASEQAAA